MKLLNSHYNKIIGLSKYANEVYVYVKYSICQIFHKVMKIIISSYRLTN